LAIFTEQKRASLSREDIIQKALNGNNRVFKLVFDAAQMKLQEVFGMELVRLSTRKRKKGTTDKAVAKLGNSYILRYSELMQRSLLEPEERATFICWPDKEEIQMSFLVMLMSLIYAHGRMIPHDSLSALLLRLDINIEGTHDDLGSIPDLISKFIKQGYLDKYRPDSRDEKFVYVWGPRANVVFTEKAITEFIVNVSESDCRCMIWIRMKRKEYWLPILPGLLMEFRNFGINLFCNRITPEALLNLHRLSSKSIFGHQVVRFLDPNIVYHLGIFGIQSI
jgi:hypothetical protein